MTLHVVGCRFYAVQPVVHETGVKTSFDRLYVTVFDRYTDFVCDIAIIGKNDYVTWLRYDHSAGLAFVGESVAMTGAPVIEMPGLIGKTPLAERRVIAYFSQKIRTSRASHAHRF